MKSRTVPREAAVTLLSRTPVCENAVFSVYLDHIADTRGHEVPRYLSVIPKNSTGDSITGAAILPIINNKAGLIRVFRHPLGRWSWEVPKGMVERGEVPAATAIRELREETGYSVTTAQLLDLGMTAPDAGITQARLQLYSVVVMDTDRALVAHEMGHGEMAFFSNEQTLELIAGNDIEDACTLAILFKHTLSQRIPPLAR